jgi:hypothetical protein
MKTRSFLSALTTSVAVFCGFVAFPASAQTAIYPQPPIYQPLSAQQLDSLLGPIALYPDPLLAQILPASTYPAQVVLADRYVAGGGDPNLAYTQPWDPSVQALTHYPSILRYLDDNLAWTTEVGQAFLYQQADVTESIQRLRLSAYNFGNLRSTPQEEVVFDGGAIEILPAQPDVVYVPVYLPDYVYDASGYGVSFGASCYLGGWLDCDFDWSRHELYWWHGYNRDVRWWHQTWERRESGSGQQAVAWTASHSNGHGFQLARNEQGEAGRNGNVTANNIFSRPEPSSRPAAGTPYGSQVHSPADHGTFQGETPGRPENRPAANGGYNTPETGGNWGNEPGRSYQTGNTSRPLPQAPTRNEYAAPAPQERPAPAPSEHAAPAPIEHAAPAPVHTEAAHSEPAVSPSAPASQSGAQRR